MTDQPATPTPADDAAVAAVLEAGGALKSLRGLEDDDLEAIHLVAHNLYSQGRFDQAEGAFGLLCLYDHRNPDYLMGLGACRQMQQDFGSAVRAYAQCAFLNPKDPLSALHAAECYLALGDLLAAESGFYAAALWAGDDPAHGATKRRAQLLMTATGQRISAIAKEEVAKQS